MTEDQAKEKAILAIAEAMWSFSLEELADIADFMVIYIRRKKGLYPKGKPILEVIK